MTISDHDCINNLKTDFAKVKTCETSPPRRDNPLDRSQKKKITTTCGGSSEKLLTTTGPLQQTFISQNEGSQNLKIILLNKEDTAKYSASIY
jgi:hypothetical protein